jgi:lipopolysaccharide transport system permease protein
MRQFLFLLKELVKRDFHGRYAGSALGLVWSLVQPLWLLVLFTFVFDTILQVSLLGERTENFSVFLFAALLPWMAVHEGVTRGASAITDNSPLVKKLTFPAEVLILAAVLGALLHEAIALGVFAVVLVALGHLAPGGLPLLLVAVPLQLALTLGLGLLLAAANVFFRDVAQVLGLVLSAWFYLTPIVYPLSLVPEWVLPLVLFNPLTALVELYRQALLGGTLELPPGTGSLAVLAVVVLGSGAWLFRRLAPSFVDEI